MPLTFIRRLTKNFLIIINVVIGILFLGGAYVNYFDPEKYWFISLLTLILPFLILTLVIFFVFWLFVRPFWCLISIVFLFIGRDAVQNIIPLRFASHFEMKKDSSSIRVMSWNVEQLNIQHYKTDPGGLQKILNLIKKYDPDIVSLQEVVAGENPDAINYYPDIVKELGYKDNFFAYQLTNDFDRHHHFGTIIFSKFPIVRKQFMINNPDDYNSTFQFVDMVVGADTVRVFNVHLQSLKFSKENREYLDSLQITKPSATESKSVIRKYKRGLLRRAVQARFLKDEMNHTPYPIILCGDFNDVPGSYAYNTIGEGLQNAFVKKGAGLSPTFDGISPTLRIDNIFTDNHFVISQYERIKSNLSDHFPIIADVYVKPLDEKKQ